MKQSRGLKKNLNKNLKGCLWKKEHITEQKSETRFYLVSSYAAM